MQCFDIQEKLSAYLEGSISSEEKKHIDEHLKSCQKCNISLADLRKTIKYVQNLENIEPPAWLTQKIMAKIKTEAKPEKGIWQKLFYPLHVKLPIEAVGVILIAVTTIYIFKTIQPEIKLAKAPTEERISQEPLKEKKATDKDIMRREVDISKDKVLQESRKLIVPLEKRDKRTFEVERSESTGKTETIYEKAAPPEFPQQSIKKEKIMPSTGAMAKDESRQRVLSPAPPLRALAERKKEIIPLTVHVKDIKTARQDIEKAVTQLNGEITEAESLGNKDVLTVELDSKQLNGLIEKTKLIGVVEEKEKPLEGREGYIEIRIEIVKISKQPQ